MDVNNAILNAALEYHDLDLAVFPLPAGKKKGYGRWGKFAEAPPDKPELEFLFRDGGNIACLCGTPSGNLVALDCDGPAIYAETGQRLAADGISTWTVRRPPNGTAHDGGGTFLLRTPIPVASSGKTPEVRAEGEYTILPPSLHEGGGLYYHEYPPTALFTLPSLTALPWLHLAPAQDKPSSCALPRLAKHLLRGDPGAIAGYHSRSEAEAAICASLALAGFQFSDAVSEFITHPGPGKFQELYQASPKNGMRYLSLTWHCATEWLAEVGDRETVHLARSLRAWALARPWPGRSGATNRAIYLSHLLIAERRGETPYHASCRDLGELSGVHWQTAANANHRLVAAGLIQLVTPATPELAHVWDLTIPPESGTKIYTPSHLESEGVSTLVHAQAHDAFRSFHGLGKGGGELLMALADAGDEGASEAELAAQTGRCLRTVRRKLRSMLTLGLVAALGEGYWCAVSDPDLDGAARELGTAGAGKHQRAAHTRARRGNRFMLERGRQGKANGEVRSGI